MSLTSMILDVLEHADAPAEYQKYTGKSEEYISFFYMPQIDVSADDSEPYSAHLIQVDVFTPYNPKKLAEQVKSLMKQAGFKKNFEHEMYEDDTNLFHVALRFYTTKENKED